jgi:hypothetical protein
MKTKILGCIVVLGVAACSFMSCTEPQAPCQTGPAAAADYATLYTVTGTIPAGCTPQTGDLIGMEFYHPELVNSDGSTTFNPAIGHVAIQGDFLGLMAAQYAGVGEMDTTAGDETFAYGAFKTALPDSNDLCYVVTDSTTTVDTGIGQTLKDNLTAQQTFTAVSDTAAGKPSIGMACVPSMMDADCGMATSGVICDATTSKCVLGCRGAMGNGCDATFNCSSTDSTAGTCSLPAQSASYVWSNVELYTTAAAQGTQFQADLVLTTDVSGQSCTINYKAIGVWPGVACEAVDAMGNPTGMPNDDDCNPCSEPAIGRAIGSGINFNFPTHCDPTLLYCVLVDEATYKPNATDVANGVQQSGVTTPATSIPQLMPDGDARIIQCQGE